MLKFVYRLALICSGFISIEGHTAVSIEGKNIIATEDFLVSMEEEIEKLYTSDDNDISQDELNTYVSYIKSAKDCLKLIRAAKAKKNSENNKDMENLIREFDEKMENIEQIYKKIMARSRKKANCEQYFTKYKSLSTFNNVSCSRNTRPIMKKPKTEETKVVAITGDIIETNKSSQGNRVIPIKDMDK
jgi:hypothetical protein